MIYAPIIIPTLNRIEHLRRCITSLQNNAWAKYTPLIISVDYPPEERYKSGYKQVCKYLGEEVTGFQSVKVIYQSQNLGAYENAIYLIEYVKKEYDRYIFSEDDNEFSPNFIEYIDKGLSEFENDKSIIAICSSGVDEDETKTENIVLSQNFAAYGYGTWITKMEEYHQQINRENLESIAKNTKVMLKLACAQPRFIFALQSAIFKKEKVYQLPNDIVPVIDQTIIMYMFSEQKYVIAPCSSKVRNWGYDGSGENCSKDIQYDASRIKIDREKKFDYNYKYPLKKAKFRGGYSLENICRIILVFFKIWFWRLKTKLEK